MTKRSVSTRTYLRAWKRVHGFETCLGFMLGTSTWCWSQEHIKHCLYKRPTHPTAGSSWKDKVFWMVKADLRHANKAQQPLKWQGIGPGRMLFALFFLVHQRDILIWHTVIPSCMSNMFKQFFESEASTHLPKIPPYMAPVEVEVLQPLGSTSQGPRHVQHVLKVFCATFNMSWRVSQTRQTDWNCQTCWAELHSRLFLRPFQCKALASIHTSSQHVLSRLSH